MKWTVKKINENTSSILIGYSYLTDECDGLIFYDKSTEAFSVNKQSVSCDDFESKRLYQFLYGIIEDKKLTDKKYNIVTG